ncbi:MAG TPA: hypothetical protein VFZ00_00105 [Solirubrobacter sp.]|jgi:thioredoxin 2|nr:hypothetical protein [Solirubrobacter sp.]
MSIIACPSCGTRNRVGPIASGAPRCARCKTTLPWLVNVDDEPALGKRFGARSIPLLVLLRDGREVDRSVGALPRAALERRLEPVITRA